MKASRHLALFLGLFWISSMAWALTAPVEWTTSRGGRSACTSCHVGLGFKPLEGAGPSSSLRTEIQTPSSFLNYVKVTMGGNSTAMSGIDATDAEVIRKYLLQRLYGEITTPSLDSSNPPSYSKDLGSVVVGSQNSTTFTLSNARSTSVGYSVASTNPQFTIGTESCLGGGRIIASGGTCTVIVHFAPSATGLRSGTVTFTVDALPQAVSVSGTGLAAIYSVNNSNLPITATVGSSNSAQATVTNSGTSPLLLSNVALGGASPAEYSLTGSTCTTGASVAPGGTCVVQVTFSPLSATAPGSPRTAAVDISHNAAGSSSTINLSGTANPAPAPSILASALSLAFANTQLGGNLFLPLTITNNGTAPLNLSSISVSGTHASDFSRSGTCAVGTPLAVNASCSVGITFAPLGLSSRSGTLVIQSDASNGGGNLSVGLSGSGIPVPAPVVSWSAPSLAFGNQTLGGLYQARQVTLTNTGDAALVINSLVVGAGPFSLVSASPCGASLAAGASCNISLNFSPASVGSAQATLTLASNAAGSPHTVALSGQGTTAAAPVLAWSPLVSTLDFGNVAVGSASATQTVTVSNQGPGGATIALINMVGVDAAQFSITPVGCAAGGTLFEGQTCDLILQFNPGFPGTRSAQVQMASSGSPPTALTVTGVGMGGPTPMMAWSEGELAFGSVRVGASSAPQEVVLSSSGSGPLLIAGMSVTGPFELNSKTCPALPFTLPSGSTCVMTVSLKPAAVGASVGTLSLSSNAANTAAVSLTGQGQAAAEASGGGCSIATHPSAFDPTLWLLGAAAAGVLWHRRRQAQGRQP